MNDDVDRSRNWRNDVDSLLKSYKVETLIHFADRGFIYRNALRGLGVTGDDIESCVDEWICDSAPKYDACKGQFARFIVSCLTSALRNEIKYIRRKKRFAVGKSKEYELDNHITWTVDTLLKQEAIDSVRIAIGSLSEQDQKLYSDLFIGQEKQADISIRLGVSKQVVNARVSSLYRKLRKLLTHLS